jgi:transcription elongation factor Elf1
MKYGHNTCPACGTCLMQPLTVYFQDNNAQMRFEYICGNCHAPLAIEVEVVPVFHVYTLEMESAEEVAA